MRLTQKYRLTHNVLIEVTDQWLATFSDSMITLVGFPGTGTLTLYIAHRLG